MEFKSWRHVFKLDPAKSISDSDLELICQSKTDGIIVGGSDEITAENVVDLLVRVKKFNIPVILEVSTIESVTPGYDYFFIPTVLNSTDTKWVKDIHHQAIKEYGDFIEWEELVAEGYIILNPHCKAAKLTHANATIADEDVIAYARLAEHYFKLPILYIEYSGMFGDVNLVAAIKYELDNTQLFYGGGIRTTEQAAAMAKFADTVVVGNLIYENMNDALSTVKAVKNTI